MYEPLNQTFKELLEKNDTFDRSDCSSKHMDGGMYLPPAIIKELTLKFSKFIPVGLNCCHSLENAHNTLKNNFPNLLQLLNADKIDPSNALEIFKKASLYGEKEDSFR